MHIIFCCTFVECDTPIVVTYATSCTLGSWLQRAVSFTWCF